MKRIILIVNAAVGVLVGAYQLQSLMPGHGGMKPSGVNPAKRTTGDAKNVRPAGQKQGDATDVDDYDRNPPDSGTPEIVRSSNSRARRDDTPRESNGRSIRTGTARPGVNVKPGPPSDQQPFAGEASSTVSPVQPPQPVQTTPPPAVGAGVASLRGLSEAQVQERFGPPALTYSGVWHYQTRAGTLRIYFENGYVSQWLPADFDLSALASRR